ncbi:hypothetical protein JOD02_001590 [Caldicoprobacter guelmensis]|uniref:cache domain-containing protein n=1 Tax=Caldicoprobacter guelmensis TaxID=1170224 RepID=UPI00195C6BD8|nr:cache domain-containing protein [Caldicoprobacter guelmensis]MBM7582733.1 hypothetical protein [Caldicoprobacter guelmensis]
MRKRVKNQFQWEFIKIFMFRYIVVMLLPIFIISIIYFSSLKVIEQYTIHSNIKMLDKIRSMLESRIDEVNSIIEQIAWNSKISRFNMINEPFKGANTYKILETRAQLYNYSLTNSFILDYYVLYLNSGIVIGPEQTYRLEQFYRFFFNYEGIDYNEWIEEIFRVYNRGTIIPERQAFFKGNSYKVLTYMRDLGATPTGRRSKVMFLLNGDVIRNLLNGFEFSEQGCAYITDENGYLLSAFPSQIDEIPVFIDMDGGTEGYQRRMFNGEDMLFIYIISQNTGWRYVVVQPYENVMKKVSNIKKISCNVFSGAIILGLVIAFLWSNLTSVSLKKLFDLISQHGKMLPIKDPFEYIQHSVHEIINSCSANLKVKLPILVI